ncbi:MAG: Asp-tRNA(Asn)/Glu-tRNA(Gln) amidotransferase subunit GatB [Candidatus Paceibacterota bacterium]|jgi:aspartyl-tRNA(Asn)/glutamyl-tRNA(Gln) amidotransferase subunit B|nr:Asp-tRNA(Asn)/Glu-tRNA(Gln) amidotransferase subunit GatB [Candidatus Paceibacterota bacterium]MDD4831068.1 Asp-tRNA(Asn)/Glu-tRNA(Gln) amidotransferase subunit GatB [Candidatus Paceibacterota bacterium]MDD4875467.1 Asp-tRNA(Asn)/Glu-tRNA(Gln) amidotransferase subunit GatB [Candidatus Paceibacterota bacterium]
MLKPTIGLEIHAELNTASKMFCSCKNEPDPKNPNINICPICMGHPGTLPTINQEAIKKVIKTGMALNCSIPLHSKFDRKNYFYPDLPKGYQVSQYDEPLCEKGELEVKVPANKEKGNAAYPKNIRVRRVHMEEDTGRLLHPDGADHSLVDFNRAGVPLMELVTEPDIRSAVEARCFAEELQLILRYIDVSFADMEKGQMRVEANISLSEVKDGKLPENEKEMGIKVEIKNLNSFKAVERAIDYEIKRQAKALEKGEKIIQETRGWDEIKGKTYSQREKEEAKDYRYFPEPDLPPMDHSEEFLREIKCSILELPAQKRQRLAVEYGLNEIEAEAFVQNKELSRYFEKTVSELSQWVDETNGQDKVGQEELLKLSKLCSNYLLTDIQGLLNGESIARPEFLITPENFAELVCLIHQGKISSKIAKTVLLEMYDTGADPSHVIESKGLSQISDSSEIKEIIKKVIEENPKPVEDYKQGKEASFQFLIGKIMAASRGKANPEIARQVLKESLK